jgi:hypothetical protein
MCSFVALIDAQLREFAAGMKNCKLRKLNSGKQFGWLGTGLYGQIGTV